MSVRGRPFRFLTFVAGGWFSARVLLLWPITGSLPQAIREALPLPQSGQAHAGETIAIAPQIAAPDRQRDRRTIAGASRQLPIARDPARVQLALLGLVRYGAVPQRLQRRATPAAQPPSLATLPPAEMPTQGPRGRWSASAWLIARDDGDAPTARLGGSQGGIRVRYRLDHADRIALAARIATPLAGIGREAAIGLEWRPLAAPVAIVAEQRFGIDGARGGPALLAIGGIDAHDVGRGVTASAYAQGGAVARDGIEPFVDGAARLSHAMARIGPGKIEMGLGIWGAAQRGAARIDIGPGVAIALPIAGRSLRIGLDWRQRIAGDATPGSGPALAIGTDF